MVSKKYIDKNNEVYEGKTKLGDLYVYMDGKKSMEFVQ
jgi:hypothetical protein